MRIQLILVSLLLALLPALSSHAEMVRVVEVRDSQTLVIERNGTRESVRLAGLAILDETRATQLLRWTVGTSWVLVERHAGGGHLVYRSPDALFVNRELVARGYARATLHGIEEQPNVIVTYLGEINPPAIASPPQTGSGTSRRSSARPARQTRTPRAPRIRSPAATKTGSGTGSPAARTRARSPRR